MTVLGRVSFLPTRGVSDVELETAQLAGIDAWNRWRRKQQLILETDLQGKARLSREQRLDLTRRLANLHATHVALLTWADASHSEVGESARRDRRPRAVLAHRSDWLRNKVETALDERGVRVVASLDDGADAMAVIVCEQPELLLVEDLLPRVPGHEVVLHTREFSARGGGSARGEHPVDGSHAGRRRPRLVQPTHRTGGRCRPSDANPLWHGEHRPGPLAAEPRTAGWSRASRSLGATRPQVGLAWPRPETPWPAPSRGRPDNVPDTRAS